MSIQIEASYSYMVTVRAEVSSLRRLETESTRLYRLLQSSVDKQVQQVGFLPDATRYGMIMSDAPTAAVPALPTVTDNVAIVKNGGSACSDKQRKLFETTAKRMHLPADELNAIAERFCGASVDQLNKRQASRLIDELFAMERSPSDGGARSLGAEDAAQEH